MALLLNGACAPAFADCQLMLEKNSLPNDPWFASDLPTVKATVSGSAGW
jgi:hypothetical protein